MRLRAAEVHRVAIFDAHQGEDGTVWAGRRYERIAAGTIAHRVVPMAALVVAGERVPAVGAGVERRSKSLWTSGRLPEAEQTALSSCGIRTVLAVPLRAGNAWKGFVEFDHCLSAREWTAQEIAELTEAARLVGEALTGGHDDAHRQHMLAGLDAALEATVDGLLVVDDHDHVVHCQSAAACDVAHARRGGRIPQP